MFNVQNGVEKEKKSPKNFVSKSMLTKTDTDKNVKGPRKNFVENLYTRS
jgi:hypothetical protein